MSKANTTYLINNKIDLQRLLADKSIKYRYNTIGVSQINIPNVLKIIKNLNTYFFACGCNLGTAFSLSTLLIMTLYLTYSNSWSIVSFLLTVLVVFLNGYLGKLLGLFYAKFRVKRCINILKIHLN